MHLLITCSYFCIFIIICEYLLENNNHKVLLYNVWLSHVVSQTYLEMIIYNHIILIYNIFNIYTKCYHYHEMAYPIVIKRKFFFQVFDNFWDQRDSRDGSMIIRYAANPGSIPVTSYGPPTPENRARSIL